MDNIDVTTSPVVPQAWRRVGNELDLAVIEALEGHVMDVANEVARSVKLPLEASTPAVPANPDAYNAGLRTAALIAVDIDDTRDKHLRTLASAAEINRQLMEWKVNPLPVPTLYPAEIEKIKAAQATASPAMSRLRQDIETLLGHIDRLQRDVDTNMRSIINKQAELKHLELLPRPDLVTNIHELLKYRVVEVKEVLNDRIIFKTRPITCVYFDKALGVNMSVPVGKFKISVSIGDMSIRVYPHEDNVHVGSYYHPHVDTAGSVCWGNAKSNVNEMRKNCDIKGIITTLVTLLEAYNPDSPYVQLYEFDRAYNPDKYKNMEHHYVRDGHIRINSNDEFNGNYVLEIEDDDYTFLVYEAFRKKVKGTNMQLDDNIYIKAEHSDSYDAMPSGIEYEWCDSEGYV